MRSLRTRLLALWLVLAASAIVTGFVLFEFYRQSANSQIMRAEDVTARSCRDIGDRYAFVVAGWSGSTSNIDNTLKQMLVVQAALARAPGVEGGTWQADAGSLAYAFPTYEGTGRKTDLPEAELASIRQVNGDAARTESSLSSVQPQLNYHQTHTKHADGPTCSSFAAPTAKTAVTSSAFVAA